MSDARSPATIQANIERMVVEARAATEAPNPFPSLCYECERMNVVRRGDVLCPECEANPAICRQNEPEGWVEECRARDVDLADAGDRPARQRVADRRRNEALLRRTRSGTGLE